MQKTNQNTLLKKKPTKNIKSKFDLYFSSEKLISWILEYSLQAVIVCSMFPCLFFFFWRYPFNTTIITIKTSLCTGIYNLYVLYEFQLWNVHSSDQSIPVLWAYCPLCSEATFILSFCNFSAYRISSEIWQCSRISPLQSEIHSNNCFYF